MKKLIILFVAIAALIPLQFVSMEKPTITKIPLKTKKQSNAPQTPREYKEELGMITTEEKIDCKAELTIKNETGHTCLVLIDSNVFTLPAGLLGYLGISQNLSFYKTANDLAYAEAKVKFKNSSSPDLILRIFRYSGIGTPVYRTEYTTFPLGEEQNTHAKEVETEGSVAVTITLKGSVMQDSTITAKGDSTKCIIQ